MEILKKNQIDSNFDRINNTKDRIVCDLFGYHHIVIPGVCILPYI